MKKFKNEIDRLKRKKAKKTTCKKNKEDVLKILAHCIMG